MLCNAQIDVSGGSCDDWRTESGGTLIPNRAMLTRQVMRLSPYIPAIRDLFQPHPAARALDLV